MVWYTLSVFRCPRDSSAARVFVRINIVGPDALTGNDVAAIWTRALGRRVACPGDDPAEFEGDLCQFMPSSMAFDRRLMSERLLTGGLLPEPAMSSA